MAHHCPLSLSRIFRRDSDVDETRISHAAALKSLDPPNQLKRRIKDAPLKCPSRPQRLLATDR